MIFLQAPEMGLEGIVSKRLSAPYRSGPSRNWIKVKNPDVRLWCARGRSDGERQTGHRRLHGAGAEPVRGFLAGLMRRSVYARVPDLFAPVNVVISSRLI
jgi:ATP-dependent DNA ligase